MVAVDILSNLGKFHLHCPAMMNEYHARIKPITLARLRDIIRKLHSHHFMDGVLDANHVPVVMGKAGFKPNVLAKTKGDVIFIIESMKVMSEVPSELDGVVKEICVQNGDAVEFGQTVMVLE